MTLQLCLSNSSSVKVNLRAHKQNLATQEYNYKKLPEAEIKRLMFISILKN